MTNERPTLTYFDDGADPDYLSYYLDGFARLEAKRDLCLQIRYKMPDRFDALRERNDTGMHSMVHVGLFSARLADKEIYFCVDTRDPDELWGIHLPLLDEVDYYFKVNYNEAVIGETPELSAYRSKLFPVAPWFPIQPYHLQTFIGRATDAVRLGLARRSPRRGGNRWRWFDRQTTIDSLRQTRTEPHDIDLFAVMVYYHDHVALSQRRIELIRELQSRPALNAVVGLVGPGIPPDAEDLRLPRMPYAEYLSYRSRAKMSIYMRGVHECISPKFGQYLAMGQPIVGEKLRQNQTFLYSLEAFDRQFAYDTPSELADRAVALAQQPDELAALAQANARTFDEQLSPTAAVQQILETIQQ